MKSTSKKRSYIYIVFSSTPYKMGSFIRTITRNKYNHVSISLNKDLKEMYSFARIYKNTPFYGGFVKETSSRFIKGNKKALIKVCAIPIDKKKKQEIINYIDEISQNKDIYLYNTFSAISFLLHKKIEIKKAYTCIEFIVSILNLIDNNFDQQKFYTIKELEKKLNMYVVYNGEFPLYNGFVEEDNYNNHQTITYNLKKTTSLLKKLIKRMFEK